MPRRNSNTFPVVTATVVAIAAIGFAVRAVRPSLPPDPANRLQFETAEFLVQGSHQQIDWRPFGPEAFAEAKARNKPTLLLIGASWSELAHEADENVFPDPDIEAILAQRFICVRLDVQDQPQWMGALLPLSRGDAIRDPGFQLYFLDPNGRVFGDAGTLGFGPPLNAIETLSILQQRSAELEAFQRNAPNAIAPGEKQAKQEAELLEPQTFGPPDVDAQLRRVVGLLNAHGGLTIKGYARPFPMALRLLLRSGSMAALDQAIKPCVSGGLVDWLDGGWFKRINYLGRQDTDFAKLAITNAEMMDVCAEAFRVTGQPIYRLLAQRAFLWLSNDMSSDGRTLAARLSDDLVTFRSARSSIPVPDVGRLLSAEDAAFARQALGLRVETNRMMTIQLAQPERALREWPRAQRIIDRFRSNRPTNPLVIRRPTCDVAAAVSAHMSRTAHLLNDPDLMRRADHHWRAIQPFIVGSDVLRRLDSDQAQRAILKDYLAVSDACLQRYLATGDENAFRTGLEIFRRASFLFESPPGVWRASQEAPSAIGIDVQSLPDVLDDAGASDTAHVINLAWSFGQILRTAAGPAWRAEAGRWSQTADTAIRQFGSASDQFGALGCGYFEAARQATVGKVALTCGPQAADLANELARRCPKALVVRELKTFGAPRRLPGVYAFDQANGSGPLSVENAARSLGR